MYSGKKKTDDGENNIIYKKMDVFYISGGEKKCLTRSTDYYYIIRHLDGSHGGVINNALGFRERERLDKCGQHPNRMACMCLCARVSVRVYWIFFSLRATLYIQYNI